MPWIAALLPKVGPLLLKQWLPIVLVGLLVGQQAQLWGARREGRALQATIEGQKAELAEVRGAIVKLTEAAKILKPGETTTIYVDRPFIVRVPGQVVTREVPVVVTRTEKTIETKVETVQLPAKEIQTIIDKSPQSLIFDLTASRDIKAGEKFRVVVSQIQPGIWQPILEIGAPITAEVRTVTPVERIPQIREPSRWTFSAYGGWSSVDALVAGARARYALNRTWSVEGQAERRFTPGLWEYRILAVATF
jgi:hypothetical protein